MSIYFVKGHKAWRYDFEFKKQRYTRTGFNTKADATAAMAARKKSLKLGIDTTKSPGDFILDENVKDRLDALRGKYHDFMVNPMNGLPELIDMMMKDFWLPYCFKDIAEIVKNYRRQKVKIPAKIRVAVLKRDGACRLCGRKPPEVQLQVDHIRPASKGGLTEERNLRALCRECNRGKSDD